MNKVVRTMGSVGFGAGLMYVLDPHFGRRRRAVARDKMVSMFAQSGYVIRKAGRDLEHRAAGLAADARRMLRSPHADDDIVVARVRAKLGHTVSRPHLIEVASEGGRVTLRGPVLDRELHRILHAVWSVRGVLAVDNRLEVYPGSKAVAGIKEAPPPVSEKLELGQSNWTPGIRLLAAVAGSALTVYGFYRRDSAGFAAAVTGAGMMARAISNRDIKTLLGISGGSRAIDIEKTLHLRAPLKEVYAFWRNYSNFPQFMTHLREVHELPDGRSYWVAEGPAGTRVAWHAAIVREIPDRLMSWQSLPGSVVNTAGTVHFDAEPDGTTRIQIRMSYSPPAGAFGHLVASLFGANPRREIDEDLVRLKSLIEFGRTRSREGSVVRRDEFPNLLPQQPGTV